MKALLCEAAILYNTLFLHTSSLAAVEDNKDKSSDDSTAAFVLALAEKARLRSTGIISSATAMARTSTHRIKVYDNNTHTGGDDNDNNDDDDARLLSSCHSLCKLLQLLCAFVQLCAHRTDEALALLDALAADEEC